MPRLKLTPQKHEFFSLYSDAAGNAVQTAQLLCDLLAVFPADGDRLIEQIKEREHEVDHVDEAAHNLMDYGVKRVPERAQQQADVILRAAGRLREAVDLLDGFKDSREQLIELRALEDEGDTLLRNAIAELFRSGQDAISIIRWKDIHERLEEACDALENAADVLEAILVKNR